MIVFVVILFLGGFQTVFLSPVVWKNASTSVKNQLPDLMKKIGIIYPRATVTPKWQVYADYTLQQPDIVMCTSTLLDKSICFFAATSDVSGELLKLYRVGFFHQYDPTNLETLASAEHLATSEAISYQKLLSRRSTEGLPAELGSCLHDGTVYDWKIISPKNNKTEQKLLERRRLDCEDLYAIYRNGDAYHVVVVSHATFKQGLLIVKYKETAKTEVKGAQKLLVKYLLSDEYSKTRILPLGNRWATPEDMFLNPPNTIGRWINSNQNLNKRKLCDVEKLRIVNITTDKRCYILFVFEGITSSATDRLLGIGVQNEHVFEIRSNEPLAFSTSFSDNSWKPYNYPLEVDLRQEIEKAALLSPFNENDTVVVQKWNTINIRTTPSYRSYICSCEEKMFFVNFFLVGGKDSNKRINFVSPVGTPEEVELCYKHYALSMENLMDRKYVDGLLQLPGISLFSKSHLEVHGKTPAEEKTIIKSEWIVGPTYLAFPPLSEMRETKVEYWYCFVGTIPLDEISGVATASRHHVPDAEVNEAKGATVNAVNNATNMLNSFFVIVRTYHSECAWNDREPPTLLTMGAIISPTGYTSPAAALEGLVSFIKKSYACSELQ